MRGDDDDEEETGVGQQRYPVMPSLVALQQMRNRLNLAYLGKKLMKWTAVATGKELRVIAQELGGLMDDYEDDVSEAFLLLARARYFYPNLNSKVLENVPDHCAVGISPVTRNAAGVKLIVYNILDQDEDPYPYLGIEKGGAVITSAKVAWRNLLKFMVLMVQLRESFKNLHIANRNATKKKNCLQKLIIPKIVRAIMYIQSELEELEREEIFRLKLFQKITKLKKLKQTEFSEEKTVAIEEQGDTRSNIDNQLRTLDLPLPPDAEIKPVDKVESPEMQCFHATYKDGESCQTCLPEVNDSDEIMDAILAHINEIIRMAHYKDSNNVSDGKEEIFTRITITTTLEHVPCSLDYSYLRGTAPERIENVTTPQVLELRKDSSSSFCVCEKSLEGEISPYESKSHCVLHTKVSMSQTESTDMCSCVSPKPSVKTHECVSHQSLYPTGDFLPKCCHAIDWRQSTFKSSSSQTASKARGSRTFYYSQSTVITRHFIKTSGNYIQKDVQTTRTVSEPYLKYCNTGQTKTCDHPTSYIPISSRHKRPHARDEKFKNCDNISDCSSSNFTKNSLTYLNVTSFNDNTMKPCMLEYKPRSSRAYMAIKKCGDRWVPQMSEQEDFGSISCCVSLMALTNKESEDPSLRNLETQETTAPHAGGRDLETSGSKDKNDSYHNTMSYYIALVSHQYSPFTTYQSGSQGTGYQLDVATWNDKNVNNYFNLYSEESESDISDVTLITDKKHVSPVYEMSFTSLPLQMPVTGDGESGSADHQATDTHDETTIDLIINNSATDDMNIMEKYTSCPEKDINTYSNLNKKFRTKNAHISTTYVTLIPESNTPFAYLKEGNLCSSNENDSAKMSRTREGEPGPSDSCTAMESQPSTKLDETLGQCSSGRIQCQNSCTEEEKQTTHSINSTGIASIMLCEATELFIQEDIVEQCGICGTYYTTDSDATQEPLKRKKITKTSAPNTLLETTGEEGCSACKTKQPGQLPRPQKMRTDLFQICKSCGSFKEYNESLVAELPQAKKTRTDSFRIFKSCEIFPEYDKTQERFIQEDAMPEAFTRERKRGSFEICGKSNAHNISHLRQESLISKAKSEPFDIYAKCDTTKIAHIERGPFIREGKPGPCRIFAEKKSTHIEHTMQERLTREGKPETIGFSVKRDVQKACTQEEKLRSFGICVKCEANASQTILGPFMAEKKPERVCTKVNTTKISHTTRKPLVREINSRQFRIFANNDITYINQITKNPLTQEKKPGNCVYVNCAASNILNSRKETFTCERKPKQFCMDATSEANTLSYSNQEPFTREGKPGPFGIYDKNVASNVSYSNQEPFTREGKPGPFSIYAKSEASYVSYSNQEPFTREGKPGPFGIHSKSEANNLSYPNQEPFTREGKPGPFSIYAKSEKSNITNSNQEPYTREGKPGPFSIYAKSETSNVINSNQESKPGTFGICTTSRVSNNTEKAFTHGGGPGSFSTAETKEISSYGAASPCGRKTQPIFKSRLADYNTPSNECPYSPSRKTSLNYAFFQSKPNQITSPVSKCKDHCKKCQRLKKSYTQPCPVKTELNNKINATNNDCFVNSSLIMMCSSLHNVLHNREHEKPVDSNSAAETKPNCPNCTTDVLPEPVTDKLICNICGKKKKPPAIKNEEASVGPAKPSCPKCLPATTTATSSQEVEICSFCGKEIKPLETKNNNKIMSVDAAKSSCQRCQTNVLPEPATTTATSSQEVESCSFCGKEVKPLETANKAKMMSSESAKSSCLRCQTNVLPEPATTTATSSQEVKSCSICGKEVKPLETKNKNKIMSVDAAKSSCPRCQTNVLPEPATTTATSSQEVKSCSICGKEVKPLETKNKNKTMSVDAAKSSCPRCQTNVSPEPATTTATSSQEVKSCSLCGKEVKSPETANKNKIMSVDAAKSSCQMCKTNVLPEPATTTTTNSQEVESCTFCSKKVKPLETENKIMSVDAAKSSCQRCQTNVLPEPATTTATCSQKVKCCSFCGKEIKRLEKKNKIMSVDAAKSSCQMCKTNVLPEPATTTTTNSQEVESCTFCSKKVNPLETENKIMSVDAAKSSCQMCKTNVLPEPATTTATSSQEVKSCSICDKEVKPPETANNAKMMSLESAKSSCLKCQTNVLPEPATTTATCSQKVKCCSFCGKEIKRLEKKNKIMSVDAAKSSCQMCKTNVLPEPATTTTTNSQEVESCTFCSKKVNPLETENKIMSVDAAKSSCQMCKTNVLPEPATTPATSSQEVKSCSICDKEVKPPETANNAKMMSLESAKSSCLKCQTNVLPEPATTTVTSSQEVKSCSFCSKEVKPLETKNKNKIMSVDAAKSSCQRCQTSVLPEPATTPATSSQEVKSCSFCGKDVKPLQTKNKNKIKSVDAAKSSCQRCQTNVLPEPPTTTATSSQEVKSCSICDKVVKPPETANKNKMMSSESAKSSCLRCQTNVLPEPATTTATSSQEVKGCSLCGKEVKPPETANKNKMMLVDAAKSSCQRCQTNDLPKPATTTATNSQEVKGCSLCGKEVKPPATTNKNKTMSVDAAKSGCPKCQIKDLSEPPTNTELSLQVSKAQSRCSLCGKDVKPPANKNKSIESSSTFRKVRSQGQIKKKVKDEINPELGYFETEFKEITKISRYKNLDGTITDEKQTITIKTEKKFPRKPSDETNIGTCISSQEYDICCKKKSVNEMKNLSDKSLVSRPDKVDKNIDTNISSIEKFLSCENCPSDIIFNTWKAGPDFELTITRASTPSGNSMDPCKEKKICDCGPKKKEPTEKIKCQYMTFLALKPTPLITPDMPLSKLLPTIPSNTDSDSVTTVKGESIFQACKRIWLRRRAGLKLNKQLKGTDDNEKCTTTPDISATASKLIHANDSTSGSSSKHSVRVTYAQVEEVGGSKAKNIQGDSDKKSPKRLNNSLKCKESDLNEGDNNLLNLRLPEKVKKPEKKGSKPNDPFPINSSSKNAKTKVKSKDDTGPKNVTKSLDEDSSECTCKNDCKTAANKKKFCVKLMTPKCKDCKCSELVLKSNSRIFNRFLIESGMKCNCTQDSSVCISKSDSSTQKSNSDCIKRLDDTDSNQNCPCNYHSPLISTLDVGVRRKKVQSDSKCLCKSDSSLEHVFRMEDTDSSLKCKCQGDDISMQSFNTEIRTEFSADECTCGKNYHPKITHLEYANQLEDMDSGSKCSCCICNNVSRSTSISLNRLFYDKRSRGTCPQETFPLSKSPEELKRIENYNCSPTFSHGIEHSPQIVTHAVKRTQTGPPNTAEVFLPNFNYSVMKPSLDLLDTHKCLHKHSIAVTRDSKNRTQKLSAASLPQTFNILQKPATAVLSKSFNNLQEPVTARFSSLLNLEEPVIAGFPNTYNNLQKSSAVNSIEKRIRSGDGTQDSASVLLTKNEPSCSCVEETVNALGLIDTETASTYKYVVESYSKVKSCETSSCSCSNPPTVDIIDSPKKNGDNISKSSSNKNKSHSYFSDTSHSPRNGSINIVPETKTSTRKPSGDFLPLSVPCVCSIEDLTNNDLKLSTSDESCQGFKERNGGKKFGCPEEQLLKITALNASCPEMYDMKYSQKTPDIADLVSRYKNTLQKKYLKSSHPIMSSPQSGNYIKNNESGPKFRDPNNIPEAADLIYDDGFDSTKCDPQKQSSKNEFKSLSDTVDVNVKYFVPGLEVKLSKLKTTLTVPKSVTNDNNIVSAHTTCRSYSNLNSSMGCIYLSPKKLLFLKKSKCIDSVNDLALKIHVCTSTTDLAKSYMKAISPSIKSLRRVGLKTNSKHKDSNSRSTIKLLRKQAKTDCCNTKNDNGVVIKNSLMETLKKILHYKYRRDNSVNKSKLTTIAHLSERAAHKPLHLTLHHRYTVSEDNFETVDDNCVTDSESLSNKSVGVISSSDCLAQIRIFPHAVNIQNDSTMVSTTFSVGTRYTKSDVNCPNLRRLQKNFDKPSTWKRK